MNAVALYSRIADTLVKTLSAYHWQELSACPSPAFRAWWLRTRGTIFDHVCPAIGPPPRLATYGDHLADAKAVALHLSRIKETRHAASLSR